MEITLEEIQKKFGELPEDLRWAIMAAKIDDHIIEIGKKNSLNVEQMGKLSLGVHLVALGVVPARDFEDTVKSNVGLPEEKNQAVINDVNEMILRNIRKELMTLHEGRKKDEESEGHGILKSAGIEIVPDGPEVPKQAILNEREEMIKKIETPNPVKPESLHPLAEQKLSGVVNSPKKETEHSGTLPRPTPPTSAPKLDPYREMPE